jgi:hypothetical protein
MLGGEGLGEQDRGPGVDGPVRVEQARVQAAERTVAAAAGVIADQYVQVAAGVRGGVDEPGGRVGKGQVEFGVVNTGAGVGQRAARAADHRLEAAGILAPRLVTVVRSVVVQEQGGPQRGQPPGHGVADARAAADTGHHGGPAT